MTEMMPLVIDTVKTKYFAAMEAKRMTIIKELHMG